jgi:antitoxin ParD1/3/4
MAVTLSEELERWIAEKVHSGRYATADDVVKEALQLLQERDEIQNSQFEELRAKINVGLEQLRRGESVTGSEVFEELQHKSIHRRNKAG